MGWFGPQGGSQDNAGKALLPLRIRGRAPLHPGRVRVLHGRRGHLHAGGAAGLPRGARRGNAGHPLELRALRASQGAHGAREARDDVGPLRDGRRGAHGQPLRRQERACVHRGGRARGAGDHRGDGRRGSRGEHVGVHARGPQAVRGMPGREPTEDLIEGPPLIHSALASGLRPSARRAALSPEGRGMRKGPHSTQGFWRPTMAVVKFDVTRREPVLDGAPFGKAGAYEKMVGVLRFATNPSLRANEPIADLGLAPRNAQGLVESSADFYLLRPTGGGNRRLFLDVPNRGRKVALGMFNSTPRSNDPTTREDFGNGFLMRQGYTVAWTGWQHDVPRQDGMMALTVPRAAWRFARTVEGKTVADPSFITLDGGFEPGKLYECLYRAQDPPLVGLGLVAVRDTAAFLRFGSADEGNPCAGALDRAYVFGVSQSGRFLRHLLYLALDEDEDGRHVFDAVVPHVAGARRGEFNCRFGQPSLNATHAIGSLFPFTHAEQEDPLTGERGALLRRLAARGHVPKIFATNSAAEYWRGDGSLVHTDVTGQHDVEAPANVRVYLFAGTQHTPGAIPPPEADPNTGARGRHRFNVVDYSPLLRAALVNLDRWVGEGVEPPPSAVPRLADKSAVPPESVRQVFEAIPGARFPDRISRPERLDFGREVERGAVELPPKRGAAFTTFVSAVDADGNEAAGIRPWELRVPLATFAGWNPRHPDQGAPGDLMSMMGSTFPLARTEAERSRTGDPRPSIAERFGSREKYLERVRREAEAMVTERHLLAEDTASVVERAALLWDFVHAPGASKA